MKRNSQRMVFTDLSCCNMMILNVRRLKTEYIFSNDMKFRTTKYNTVTFKQTLTCKPDEVDKLPFLIKGLKLAKGILIKFPMREYCPK